MSWAGPLAEIFPGLCLAAVTVLEEPAGQGTGSSGHFSLPRSPCPLPLPHPAPTENHQTMTFIFWTETNGNTGALVSGQRRVSHIPTV